MVRILITGATGFVGSHLIPELERVLGNDAAIVATAHDGKLMPDGSSAIPLDVTDDDAVDRAVVELMPSHVVHLSGVTSVTDVSADTKAAWRVNTFGALTVAEAILRRAPHCVLVFAGSGLIYGETAKAGHPLNEQAVLAPTDDYAVTKAAADLALGALTRRGLRSIRLRLFNHTGPRQSEGFVVPGFAAQIARIEAGLQPPVIRVGNLDAARDFLDVRDVATAYALTVLRSQELAPGLILNIASGTPHTIRSVLDQLLTLSRVPIKVEVDPARLRPSDTPLYVGDAAAARKLLGWQPRHAFSETLKSVLEYWRQSVSAPRRGSIAARIDSL
jgi:GDP-4-dehydro-6-deoxy-D-mannose reductase